MKKTTTFKINVKHILSLLKTNLVCRCFDVMQLMNIEKFYAEGIFLKIAAERHIMLIRPPAPDRDNTHLVQRV